MVMFHSTERVSSSRTIQDCLGRLQTGNRTHRDRRLIVSSHHSSRQIIQSGFKMLKVPHTGSKGSSSCGFVVAVAGPY